MSKVATDLITTIGLEMHVELTTATKMFCGCRVAFGGEPNIRVCPVCLGHPGVLPVPNELAIEYTTKIAMALGCEIAPRSIFHRKNYFYPDMPKNYQITQYDIPIGSGGWVDIEVGGEPRRIGITRVHLEEDTGKIVHRGEGGRIAAAEYSLIDFNRAGTPLVEIVTEPDIQSPEEARVFAQELRTILEYLGVSDVRMEEGSLRVDANISIAPQGERGVKVEIKNMNSMKSVYRALAFEQERLRQAVLGGLEVEQETRHWDEKSGVTTPGRSKEYSSDYRYLPEPDLTPIEPAVEWLRQLQDEQPELPAQRRGRLMEEMGLGPYDAQVLTTSRALGDFFEGARERAKVADAKQIANWVANNLAGALPEDADLAQLKVTPTQFAKLVDLVVSGEITAAGGKEVLTHLLVEGGDPERVVSQMGIKQISDRAELERAIDEAIAANPDIANRIRSGEDKPFAFLVGQVMKITRGQGNPAMVNDLLRTKLREGG